MARFGSSLMNSPLVRDATLVIGGGLILATIILLVALLPEKRESLEDVLEAEAAGTAKLFASLTPPTPEFAAMAGALVEPFLAESRIVGITTGDGRGTRWLTLGPFPPDLEPRLEDVPPMGMVGRRGADHTMEFAWELSFNNDPNRHYILAARIDARSIEDELAEFTLEAVGVTLVTAVLLVAGMVGFLNIRIIGPIRRLSDRMSQASDDPTHPERYRWHSDRAGEVGDMARSFNAMVERIGDAMSAQMTAEAEANQARQKAETALAELTRAQESLVEAEKMAALGGLVAGVAHEINTPVGNALGAISHLHRETRQASTLFQTGKLRRQDADHFIGTALEAGDIALTNIQRAATLVASFKQVAADQTAGDRRRFALGAYVEEVLVSLSPQLRRARVTVETDIPADIAMDADPGALAQVLANLISNAVLHGFGDRDPIDPGDDGETARVRIAARHVETASEIGGAEFGPSEIGNGAHIRLRVSDNGRGMTEDVRSRIFEPFFTTRRGSGGTGLGMHIVYNLVTRNLGGRIKVESAPGRGAVFTMTLPDRAPEKPGDAVSHEPNELPVSGE